MKKCFKCSQVLPLSEFYKHSGMADGHLNKCKACVKNDVTSHRNNNLDRIRDYDRKRGKLEHRKMAVLEYAATHREPFKRANRKYIDCNPHKRSAHTAVRKAIKSGALVRHPCSVCQSKKSEAHHEDYSMPLDVVWLCREHHAALHESRQDYRRFA